MGQEIAISQALEGLEILPYTANFGKVVTTSTEALAVYPNTPLK